MEQYGDPRNKCILIWLINLWQKGLRICNKEKKKTASSIDTVWETNL